MKKKKINLNYIKQKEYSYNENNLKIKNLLDKWHKALIDGLNLQICKKLKNI